MNRERRYRAGIWELLLELVKLTGENQVVLIDRLGRIEAVLSSHPHFGGISKAGYVPDRHRGEMEQLYTVEELAQLY